MAASPLDHPLVKQLQKTPTADPAARQAAVLAINSMMRGATRAGALLEQAKQAAISAAINKSSVDLQRAQQAAQEAYKQRTNAEVAKYRAAYALMAENEAGQAVSMAQAAASAKDAASQRILIQKSNYHAARRDLMVQAANATSKALKQIPPLDPTIAPAPQQERAGEQMYRRADAQARPSFNWRPSAYRAVVGNLYPADVKRAAGALVGLGDDTVNSSTGSSFLTALEASVSKGVAAAGAAAAQQGNAISGSNPTGGLALAGGGNLLTALSSILGTSQATGAAASTGTGSSMLPVVLGLGAIGVGVFVVYKFFL